MNTGRSVGRALEPVLLAVLLALASVVPVAWALQAAPSAFVIEAVDWHPLGTGQVLTLALGAVIPAGLLGGLAGALAWGRRRTLAPVAAVAVAWPTGIVSLPIVAAAFDIPLRAGAACVDGCRALLTDAEPFGGFGAYAETTLTWFFTVPYLIVPGLLLLAARRLGWAGLWMATWLSLHAALHVSTFLRSPTLVIYGALVIGVVLWTWWLWGRDGGLPAMRDVVRRWTLAIVPLVVVSGSSWTIASADWLPPIPRSVAESVVGTAVLHGFNPPDPSEWFPPIIVPRTPEGSGCLAPLVRPAGTLDLCWGGYRDNRESLPGGDVYQFRLVATLRDAEPTTWASIIVSPVGGERVLVSQIWPSGVVDGPCRTVSVEGMNFLTDGDRTNDIAEDLVCGRTTAVRTAGWKGHHVIWTCGACGATTPEGGKIALRELVYTDEGEIPTWTVAAELGR